MRHDIKCHYRNEIENFVSKYNRKGTLEMLPVYLIEFDMLCFIIFDVFCFFISILIAVFGKFTGIRYLYGVSLEFAIIIFLSNLIIFYNFST